MIIATKDNVILKVEKKKKTADELLIETGEDEKIILGTIVAAGPDVHETVKATKGIAVAYKNRVAVLPWADDDHDFYVVKEENIYGILEQ